MDVTANLESAAAAGKAAIGAAATRMATAMTGPASARDFESPMKETVRRELSELLAEHTTKDAAAILAARHGLPRRDVYARALELSRGRAP